MISFGGWLGALTRACRASDFDPDVAHAELIAKAKERTVVDFLDYTVTLWCTRILVPDQGIAILRLLHCILIFQLPFKKHLSYYACDVFGSGSKPSLCASPALIFWSKISRRKSG